MLTRLLLLILLASPLFAVDAIYLKKKGAPAGADRSGVYNDTTSRSESATPWNTTHGFSVCATVRFTDAAGEKTIVSNGDESSTPGWRLRVNGTTAGFFVRSGNFAIPERSGKSINTWYRFCGNELSQTDHWFCDGVGCLQSTANTLGDWATADFIMLGSFRETNGANKHFWPGDIAEAIEFTPACTNVQLQDYISGTRAQDIGCGSPTHITDGFSGLDEGSAPNNLTPTDVTCLAEADGNPRSITGGPCP